LKDLINKLIADDVQDFIFSNENSDADRIVLSNRQILGISSSVIAGQLKARTKASYKLPTYYRTKGIIYPPTTNLEQSSSEATGRFKAGIIRGWLKSRKNFCDLTGGFGVDSFFIAKEFSGGDVTEHNDELLAIAEHNHRALGQSHLNYYNTDAVSFLASSHSHYDLIYIDPSRRNASQKVFKLGDCEPNVVQLQSAIFSRSQYLIVKASPLLDIQQGLRELINVERVIVVAVDNECKEVLFMASRGFSSEPVIECHSLLNSGERSRDKFQFRFSEERNAVAIHGDPGTFIYEPDASIMKGGAFKSVAANYKVSKLQVNTHLYTSNQLLDNFPGRAFEILDFVKPDRKLRDLLPGGRANILIRNYPLSVEEFKKKTGLSEGGDTYVIACSGVKEKFVMIARRLR
jgi:THUMP domain-like